MSRFIDDLNRMFDEVLRSPWRQQQPTLLHPGPVGPGSVWELEVPVGGVEPEQFGVLVGGDQVTVTVGGRSSRAESAPGGHMTTERFEERRQSFRLPPGAQVAAVEASIEGHRLRLRIRLRS